MISRILLYTVAALGAIVLVVLVVGYDLPQNHLASAEAFVPEPPSAVFTTLSDVARHPEWRKDVRAVEVVRTSPLTWRERSGGDVITFEAVESRPPELLRVRIADPDLPFGGTWTYELTPEGSGTRVRVTERGEVYNPVFRFMSRFVFGHTATIDRFLAALRARAT